LLTQEQLQGIQNVQLEIMDSIHSLCQCHGIQYYLIAGSVLGAVRHGGFIPWDLDVDIAMLRPDYEKFRTVCQSALDDRFCFMDCKTNPDHTRPHAVICKKGTQLKLKYDAYNKINENFGIYMDIFPLDNAPDDEKLREKQAKKLKKLRKLKELRIPYCYSNKKSRRLVHCGISACLSWLPVRTINRWQQKLMQTYNDRETTCVCSMASQYAYKKQCMPREIYGTPTLLDFQGRQYYAPEKYLEYLTRLYGDYMQLPPPEKRQANLEIFASVKFR